MLCINKRLYWPHWRNRPHRRYRGYWNWRNRTDRSHGSHWPDRTDRRNRGYRRWRNRTNWPYWPDR